MRKEYYKIYKSKGICTSCGKNKAVEGRVMCEDCIEKDAKRVKNYDKERKRQYKKRKQELCDVFGICTTCMKREKYKGKQCIDCYLKRKKAYKAIRIDKGKLPKELWGEYGLCSICGDVRHEGSKLCKKHLEIARENARNARTFIDRENHIWKTVKNMEIERIAYISKMKQI